MLLLRVHIKCDCIRIFLSKSNDSAIHFNSRLRMSKTGFYAVQEGRVPGVYNTWAECEAQVKGFSEAVYKKFPTKQLALEFLNLGKNPVSKMNNAKYNFTTDVSSSFRGLNNNYRIDTSKPQLFLPSNKESYSTNSLKISHSTSNSKQSFYAVHIGKKRGVYRTWTECEAQLKGMDRVCYRKFDNEKDALHYAETGGIIKASKGHLRKLEISNKVVKRRKIMVDCNDELGSDYVLADPDETVVIFTDGACSENGRRKAMAGIGVYWGEDHPLNASKRLSGRQTNNRAEIHAAIHALQQAKQINAKKVRLYTDSQFLIRGITDWVKKWKENGWMLITGQPVRNKEDFIELNDVCEGLDVEWVYVKAHDDNIGNEEADRLAVEGSRLPLEPSKQRNLKQTSSSIISSSCVATVFDGALKSVDLRTTPSVVLQPNQETTHEIIPLLYPENLSKTELFYAVKRGKCPGVYSTWADCEAQLKGLTNVSYKIFSTSEEAYKFVEGATTPVTNHINSLICPLADPYDNFVCVYTDGASSSNGQEGSRAGIGVYWGPGSELNTSQRLSGRQTNNRAEIHAIVHALKQAKHLGLKNLRVFTDSQFTINGITKWIHKWKQNGWTLSDGKPVKNKEDFEELDEAQRGINVDWCYIKGHDNNPGNVEADQLAVAACKKEL